MSFRTGNPTSMSTPSAISFATRKMTHLGCSSSGCSAPSPLPFRWNQRVVGAVSCAQMAPPIPATRRVVLFTGKLSSLAFRAVMTAAGLAPVSTITTTFCLGPPFACTEASANKKFTSLCCVVVVVVSLTVTDFFTIAPPDVIAHACFAGPFGCVAGAGVSYAPRGLFKVGFSTSSTSIL
jgi:hypothetical protein